MSKIDKVEIPILDLRPLRDEHSVLDIVDNTGYENITESQVCHEDEQIDYSIDRDLQKSVYEHLNTVLSAKIKQGAYALAKSVFEDQTDISFNVQEFKKLSYHTRNEYLTKIKSSLRSIYNESQSKDGSVDLCYLLKYCLYHHSLYSWLKLSEYIQEKNITLLTVSLGNISWLAKDDKNANKELNACINSIIHLLSHRVAISALRISKDNFRLSQIKMMINGAETEIIESDGRLMYVNGKYKENFEDFLSIVTEPPFRCLDKKFRFINKKGKKKILCAWWKGLVSNEIVLDVTQQVIREHLTTNYKMNSLTVKTYQDSDFDENISNAIEKIRDKIKVKA